MNTPRMSSFMCMALLISASLSLAADPREHSFHPNKGYVPNKATAISIAKAVWTPIYGKKQIESEKPYKASMNKGVWTVTGSMHESPTRKAWTLVGGVAVAEISQKTGEILRVSHGK